jgi:hypothetical protein
VRRFEDCFHKFCSCLVKLEQLYNHTASVVGFVVNWKFKSRKAPQPVELEVQPRRSAAKSWGTKVTPISLARPNSRRPQAYRAGSPKFQARINASGVGDCSDSCNN